MSSCPVSGLGLSWFVWQFISLHHSWKYFKLKFILLPFSLELNIKTFDVTTVCVTTLFCFKTRHKVFDPPKFRNKQASLLMKNCSVKTTARVQNSQFLPTRNITIYQFVLMMVRIFYQLILNIISWIIIISTLNILKQILIDF